MDDKTQKKASALLLKIAKKVTKDGAQNVGNVTLRDEFLNKSRSRLSEHFGEDVYWTTRNTLIEEGKLERGRGRGGSVILVVDKKPAQKLARRKRRIRESALYAPFHKTLQTGWVREYGVEHHASEITAHKGSRDTGGQWTRPDITFISVGNYEFMPGKTLEVITFEIKPEDSYGIESVYETASHSAFANKSYLAIHLPTLEPESQQRDLLTRLENEAVRFGVGLLKFEDPEKWETFEIIVEPQHKTPSPKDTNAFLNRMLNETTKQAVLRLVK